jgi:hypothetical protein
VNPRRLQGPLAVFALAVAALFVGKALDPGAWLYRDAFSQPVLYRLGAVAKWLFLVLAWYYAYGAAGRLDAANPARGAWRLFAFGLLCFAAAQTILSSYQVAKGESLFPSVADVLFMAAYPSLIVAFWRFVQAYRTSGYPVGSPAEHAAIASAVALGFGVVAYFLLLPALRVEAPFLERLLNAAYPAFDFVMLLPVVILTRIAWPFRGGAVFQAWGMLLLGFVALCAADIVYAWFSILELDELDPVVDATYVVAYAAVARGTLLHRELLA